MRVMGDQSRGGLGAQWEGRVPCQGGGGLDRIRRKKASQPSCEVKVTTRNELEKSPRKARREKKKKTRNRQENIRETEGGTHRSGSIKLVSLR